MRRLNPFLLALAILAGAASVAQGVTSAANAEALFETKAKQAFMMEAGSGTILFSKNPDTLIPPASLAKLMTAEVVFHALEEGTVKVNDEFTVSENAWRKGGAPSGSSTMFAKLGSSIRVADLLQGVIVQSANDGCIVLAEGLAGSEEKFAALMNERAAAIGLSASTFRNSTGLPDPEQKVTLRDLVALARHIWEEYPQFRQYYAQRDFTWNKILQRNRNPLLGAVEGAAGMKTGFTEESGYAIVGVVNRDGKRVFLAMSGLESDRDRAEEAKRMLEWAVSSFDKIDIYGEGEILGQATVFGGATNSVSVTAGGPLALYIPITNRDRLKARVIYDGPIPAPVAKGTRIGVFRVWIGEEISQEIPVFAAESVQAGPLHRRAADALQELMTGWLRR
jgi:D-alanyl-D-alanine carboxypeptidase (penicillin-binding protein 5/6)